MHFSDVEVGKQLVVGNGTYYDALGLGMDAIRGSAYIEGPFLVGDAKSFDKVVATTMIARDVNEESNDPPRSLHVKGDVKTEGDGENSAHVLLDVRIDRLDVVFNIFSSYHQIPGISFIGFGNQVLCGKQVVLLFPTASKG